MIVFIIVTVMSWYMVRREYKAYKAVKQEYKKYEE